MNIMSVLIMIVIWNSKNEVMTMSPKITSHLLKRLRTLMHDSKYVTESLSAYIVPSVDPHNSEYLADCDQFRSFISGFNGSAGTAIITNNDARLWTDGRYYLQASQQLDSNWKLMKEGLPDTPTQGDWLCKTLPKGSAVGVDPKLLPYKNYHSLRNQLESGGYKLVPVSQNLVELVWTDRPPRPANAIIPLAIRYTGESIKQKLTLINEAMKEKNAQYLVLTALDEIAWFLNLRGSDIAYNPVFFAYVIIGHNSFTVFMNQKQVSEHVKQHLVHEAPNAFIIAPYEEIEDSILKFATNLNNYIWFSDKSNYALTRLVQKKDRLLTDITPVELMKAIKNPTEAAGLINCHKKDAVALCCYFSWLEEQLKDPNVVVTEVSGAAKLLEFRQMQKYFVGMSFPTISSVGPHGAIIHYQPNEDTDVRLTTDQMYLCDSGGQYLDGTTDVTRTFHFGKPTNFQKECYTRVLKGQIKLATSVFPRKIKGNYLDSFAREFLWEVGLDYGHGTGHGIGSYLNVHEGPQAITWRQAPDDPGLEENMFVSNEPGYYQDGEFGLRIEDIVQVVKANTPHNFSNRGYLTFNTITLVPKSINLIVPQMLTDFEIDYLNKYHQRCRDVIGPMLEKQGHSKAKEWLWRETLPIRK